MFALAAWVLLIVAGLAGVVVVIVVAVVSVGPFILLDSALCWWLAVARCCLLVVDRWLEFMICMIGLVVCRCMSIA